MKASSSIALLLAASSLASVRGSEDASARWDRLRRRLSYEKIAGYSPGSQVTDHCAIDLDQKAIEAQLAIKTNDSFEAARAIYQQGGHSKSFAQVTLQTPLGNNLKKGTPIMGENADGNDVAGKAYQDYEAGKLLIRVQYSTTNLQKSYVECQVGGLPEADRNTRGCLKGPTGTLKIGEREYAYTYDPATDNNNGRTIAGFSVKAGELMRYGPDSSEGFLMQGGGTAADGTPIAGGDGCRGCPYDDHGYFYKYYGSDTYADDWILAAFEGTRTKFDNGNADFGTYDFEGREQVIKKGTAYMSVFMYVIREFEDALDDCERDCMECNDGSVHAWDEGVCFYTGSVEGQDGKADGALLHQLADKRCADFRTCGPEGNEGGGTAKLNYDLFDLFALGNYQLTTGNCPGARITAGKIADKMYVPLIQGALRYAYKVDKMGGGEKEKAEGAVFAAAVLPRVHAASPDRATIIYENLGVGADDTSFGEVKHAFEHVYSDIGITCGDVGGLWDEASGDYYPGMEPCKHTMGTLTIQEEATVRNNALAIALGATFGALFAVAACMVLYMRSREKQGQPVFKASSEEVKGVE